MSTIKVNTLQDVEGEHTIQVEDLANKTALAGANGSANIGYGIRTQEEKNNDVVSVRDHITTAINGVTVNQAGIVAAIAAAKAKGSDLYWPSGVYVSDNTIPDFHSVKHYGPGVLKRGTTTWVISGLVGTNVVYVAVGSEANDTNDGLTQDKPIKTVQAALDMFKAPYMPTFLSGGGTFRIQFLAGTWTEGGSFTGSLVSKGYVYIAGTLAPDGVTPMTIIDGTTSTKTAGIYFDGGPTDLYVRDIDSRNFRSNSIASGFVFANRGLSRVFSDNLWASNNIWSGVNVDSIGQFNMKGGVLSANTSYNLRVRGGVAVSIGRADARITLKNNETAVQIRDCCSGHFDYVDIINHPSTPTGTALWLTNCSRTVLNNCTISNCNLGINAGGSSTFGLVATTFTNVGTQFRTTANASQDPIDGGLGGHGLSYDQFKNMHSIGLEDLTSVAPFGSSSFAQATIRTGTADWSHLVPAATTLRQLFGNPTSNAYFRRDFDFTNNRISDVVNGAVRFRITATDINPGTDNDRTNGTAAARWSTIYAGTPTISTSDEDAKQQIKSIDEACLRAWANVEYVQYKFNDAVEVKGESDARWHFGLIAQRVKAAFEAEGLDAFEYGLLCYDEWDEQPEELDVEGNVTHPYVAAGSRYGIRYEEALALECAYLRSQLRK